MKNVAVIIIVTFLTFHAILGMVLSARTACKSDCRDQYESQVEACNSTYDDPQDSEDLRTCIDNSKNDYDSCIEGCVRVEMKRAQLTTSQLLSLLVHLSSPTLSYLWQDETHLAIAKAAEYYKWYHAVGPDIARIKVVDNESCSGGRRP